MPDNHPFERCRLPPVVRVALHNDLLFLDPALEHEGTGTGRVLVQPLCCLVCLVCAGLVGATLLLDDGRIEDREVWGNEHGEEGGIRLGEPDADRSGVWGFHCLNNIG